MRTIRYADGKYPYNEITWTDRFIVSMVGFDAEGNTRRVKQEFSDKDEAIKFMWDTRGPKHYYVGETYQVRILADGSEDTCCVGYTGCGCNHIPMEEVA